MLCKHNYEIIKEKTIDSDVERLSDKGITKMPGDISTKSTYIIIYKCKKCNKIRESIFRS